ncbi:Maf family protein [Mumia sp. DW29H23]|uniref:Maf family protein n=1 Tax=Mumia sp. DW29H23 TaxID=3421241 RepID=UPI003D692653
MPPRLVLASQSPARLATLRSAGIDPEVVVSGVDESVIVSDDPVVVATELARMKARAVTHRLKDDDAIVIGCDSVLAFDGEVLGKPEDAATATARWRAMRGQAGVLHTGHCVRIGEREVSDDAATTVHFADIDDAEIEAYVATGEPLQVAGAFTIDGLGGAFVERIEGDHHNVVGLSLPLVRSMLAGLGVRWTDFWATRSA